MPPPSPTVQPMPKLTRSRATLIVLPPHLVHQWLAEIEGKISGCKDGSFAECDAGCTVDFALFLVADMHDHDVVIATYGDLKSNRNPLFKTIHWHRIVLDECQEIKVATNQIASMCARLAATNRWMVSGTPLVNQVADLHGELNFLQIWPFSLPDVVDGFWELRVQRGYDHRDETSLHLLHSLLSTVMMRHTKSQRYITSGEPLVTLPARTIEFKPFELTEKYERCAYDYIASFAADSLLDFMDDSQLDHTADSTRWRNVPRYAQLRGLMSVMSRCITSAAAIDLRSLDHLRRLLSSRRAAVIANAVGAPGSRDIPVLSAEDVVDAVADSGDDGGNDEAVRKSLHEMLPPGSTLRVGKTETEEAEMKVQRVFDRRADRSIAGDAALATVTVPGKTEKYAFTPDDLGYVETISKCEAGAMERALLFRRDFASRKEPYIDLLTSRRMSSSGKEYNLGGLHSEGFSTLYKLMAGQPAQCPLCLVEATRPTVTTCVHVFCRDCIADVLNKADEGMGTHKCPMCRRGLCHGDLMEIKMDNVLDETTTSSRPSEASGGTPPRVWECGSTTFVVPEFNIDSSERLTSAVGKSATELARYCHPQRDVLLPSLSANALHVLRMSTRFLSSRMRALIGDMKETQKTDLFAKFVVFTQYKETAVSARQDLEKHGFKCESIVSQTAGLSTQEALNAFHQDPLCNVLLLTMSSSCNGLTLTIAHVVYLLEPSPSPAAEAQAISRVHRIGQSHNVRCVIFYAKDTCEERLLAMR
ncbi:unnamed protein product, partial [Ectocarpus fasciculatus]